MLGIGSREVKVFGVAFLALCAFQLLFIPISVWEEAFWRYLNETAPIMWLGQTAWIIFFACLITIAVMVLEKVVFR